MLLETNAHVLLLNTSIRKDNRYLSLVYGIAVKKNVTDARIVAKLALETPAYGIPLMPKKRQIGNNY